MQTASTWGAAVAATLWSGLALGQVPTAPPTTTAASEATSTAPAPPPSTIAVEPATDGTQPAPADRNASPIELPSAEAAVGEPQAPAQAHADETPKKKKRKRKKRRRLEATETASEKADVARPGAPLPGAAWRLGGRHFVLSIERASSILAWNQTYTSEDAAFAPGGGTTSTEVETSGTSVALLGAGGFAENPFAVPRVAFDGVFSNGFSIGGSVGYMVTSSDRADRPSGSSSASATTKGPTLTTFVFAPRLGALIPASRTVAVWLRGGITRLSLSVEDGEGELAFVEQTSTLVDVSLDPQLVISPIPHVGILVGATLDIGVAGTIERRTGSTLEERDATASSYGVTAGLAALF